MTASYFLLQLHFIFCHSITHVFTCKIFYARLFYLNLLGNYDCTSQYNFSFPRHKYIRSISSHHLFTHPTTGKFLRESNSDSTRPESTSLLPPPPLLPNLPTSISSIFHAPLKSYPFSFSVFPLPANENTIFGFSWIKK